MNPNNYASLEASQRLHDAGIVLETDFYWVIYFNTGNSRIERKETAKNIEAMGIADTIPAPSMAEVWRELPGIIRTKEKAVYELQMSKNEKFTHAFYIDYETGIYLPFRMQKGNTNPTDALIYLLIWVRKEADHEMS
jgi:HAMP domain-containing protein